MGKKDLQSSNLKKKITLLCGREKKTMFAYQKKEIKQESVHTRTKKKEDERVERRKRRDKKNNRME